MTLHWQGHQWHQKINDFQQGQYIAKYSDSMISNRQHLDHVINKVAVNDEAYIGNKSPSDKENIDHYIDYISPYLVSDISQYITAWFEHNKFNHPDQNINTAINSPSNDYYEQESWKKYIAPYYKIDWK